MNVSVERAQGHQNAIYSIKICAKAKTELADISQNCFHEARIVLLQTELLSKIHLIELIYNSLALVLKDMLHVCKTSLHNRRRFGDTVR